MGSRMYLNTYFRDQKHFINYCRKIVSNKMGLTNFVGRKKYSSMLRRMWTKNDVNEIENFLYRIKIATPDQIEASLRRLRGKPRDRTPATSTGMYGIWSDVSKRFVFGIQKPSKSAAFRQLRREIGRNSMKWRFRAKAIKDCKVHREMFYKDLVFKEGGESNVTRRKRGSPTI